jgi:hypothetical protein
LESANSPWTKKGSSSNWLPWKHIVITREKQLSFKKVPDYSGCFRDQDETVVMIICWSLLKLEQRGIVKIGFLAQYNNQVKIVQIHDKRCRLTAKIFTIKTMSRLFKQMSPFCLTDFKVDMLNNVIT